MKEVMQQFDRQSSQRFLEYDERMKTTRQKCKDKCDEAIQKIILKDKLEKELMDKFATLHTDMQSDAIPTCVCEKSLADKVEKGCLRCGGVLGGGVMPGFGAIGGTALYALNQLKPTALKAAIAAANEAGIAAGKIAGDAAGMKVVSFGLKHFRVDELFPDIFKNFVNTKPYNEITTIANSILENYRAICTGVENIKAPTACKTFEYKFGIFIEGSRKPGPPAYNAIPQGLKEISIKAEQAAATASKNASETVSTAIKARETALIEAGFNSSITSINASIFAIVVIVLIMVIIYLILLYRRKKKMKKKLQYIKLLDE